MSRAPVATPDVERSCGPGRLPSLKQAARGWSSKTAHNVHVRTKQMQRDVRVVPGELTAIGENHMLLSVAVDIC